MGARRTCCVRCAVRAACCAASACVLRGGSGAPPGHRGGHGALGGAAQGGGAGAPAAQGICRPQPQPQPGGGRALGHRPRVGGARLRQRVPSGAACWAPSGAAQPGRGRRLGLRATRNLRQKQKLARICKEDLASFPRDSSSGQPWPKSRAKFCQASDRNAQPGVDGGGAKVVARFGRAFRDRESEVDLAAFVGPMGSMRARSENGVRLAQTMQVGPCIPVGMQR